MIDAIYELDIYESRDFLRLKPGYSKMELHNKFVKYAKLYHPKSVRGNQGVFDRLVLSYEILMYVEDRKKQKKIEEIIEEINSIELLQINQKIQKYSEMHIPDFLKEIEMNPLGVKITTGFFKTMYGLAIGIMLLIFLLQVSMGNMHFFQFIFYGLLVFGVVIRFLKRK